MIRSLLSLQEPRGRHFREKIRWYNNAFAFTSVNCTESDRGVQAGAGPQPFQIHGALYHFTGNLEPAENAQPRFAQLYFYDPQMATEFRQTLTESLDRTILSEVTAVMHELPNPYISIYRTARERLRLARAEQDENVRILLNPQMRLIVESGADLRREDLPTADEVAVLISYEDAASKGREIVLATVSGGLQFVNCENAAYMPLAYPLMFPAGDPGFHYNIDMQDTRQIGRKRVKLTPRMFYRYHLHIRSRLQQVPFSFGRLFQQFTVDVWALTDQLTLSWMRQNQKRFRADLYRQVADHLQSDDPDPTSIGHRTILPASYLGGNRFIAACYQDSMAIYRHFGRPSLFVTFTANPKWKEIRRELRSGESAEHRPDLVVRVFREKVKELLHDVKKVNVFGSFQGCVWTIEYQKRGLPHMHLLLFLTPEHRDRLLNPEWIDRVIRAEIPTSEMDPDGHLRSIVTSMLIHGPCGSGNVQAPCMMAQGFGMPKKCKKKFPKQFCPETVVKPDGYPEYRRRDTGEKVIKTIRGQQIELDNRYVVPYNPFLSRKFCAHINVEICASVKAIKYVHKYIYKGNDLATIEMSRSEAVNENDEVARHLNTRYVGPSEALWRLFEFPVHEEFPPVQKLAVHLSGEEPFFFPEDWTVTQIQEKQEVFRTTLSAFFEYNERNTDGRNRKYQDFPAAYVFKDYQWRPRQRGFTIGRVFFVNPLAGEKYYLRLLLGAITGSTSFEHLRTVDGIEYETFQAACLALGLLSDDNQWKSCFNEAVIFSSGRHLRLLFVSILIFGSVVASVQLWNLFKSYICDDLEHRIAGRLDIPTDLESPHYDYGLYLISGLLGEHSRCLADFQLSEPQFDWDQSGGNRQLQDEYDYNAAEENQLRNKAVEKFNNEQADCFQRIVRAVEERSENSHFFLQGPGGTGKTFVYRALCNHFRSQGKIVLCVASSGIAATLLDGGRTAHSRFKIPIDIHSESVCRIPKQSELAGLIQKTALIIWDEVPIQHKHCFEAVDRTLQDIMGSSQLFGGIAVVLGGDFAQILPVVRRGKRPHIVGACLRQSYIWSRLGLLRLTQNMRLQDGNSTTAVFPIWLSRLSYEESLYGSISLPDNVARFKNPQDFYSRVYPQALLQLSQTDLDVFRSRCILSGKNTTVNAINDYLVDQLPGICKELHSSDSIDSSEGIEITAPPVEILQTFSSAALPLAKLRLKVGAPILLIRNLQPRHGLCNGTRLSVVSLSGNCIEARILGGSFHGEIRLIPRIKQVSKEDDDLPFIIQRIQFPVKLCFAMTINKSQGQSFDHVGVDLREPVFTHGQFYVAMSRVTAVRNLYILLPSGENTVDKVLNIVYPEVLLR